MFIFNHSSSIASNSNSNSNSNNDHTSDDEESTVASMTSEVEETTKSTTNKRQRLSTMGDYSKVQQQHQQLQHPPTEIVCSGTPTKNHHHDVLTMTPDRARLTPPLPTFEELSKELCKICDTDHYSREEAKRSLVNLYRWGYTDASTFLSDFSELGGIQRVLLFLKNNKTDPSCVMVAAKVIMAFTHRPCTHPNYNIANEITKYLTMRDGIQILLDAGKENNNSSSNNGRDGGGRNGESDRANVTSQLHALRWVWMSLMNITEKKSTFEIVGKDVLLGIFDFFLRTMAKLGSNVDNYKYAKRNIVVRSNDDDNTTATDTKTNNSSNSNNSNSGNNKPSGSSITAAIPYEVGSSSDFQLKIQRAFSSFCSPGGTSRKRTATEMITHPPPPTTTAGQTKTKTTNNSLQEADTVNAGLTSLVLEDMFHTLLNITQNAPMTRDDFQGTDLLKKCIVVLKNLNGEWINNKELFVHASCFFVQCSKKDILSTKEDYEIAFPLIVQCISNYPEESFRGELFDLVRNAYSSVGVDEGDDDDKRSFLQGSGIFGAVASAWESSAVNDETKNAAHQLLKELL